MLQQFFADFIILIIFMIGLIIIKIAVPMWRFMVRADAVIRLYPLFKDLLKEDFSKKEKIKLQYGKFELKFSNTNEASIEFEKMVMETLEYYDKLDWIAVVDDSFKGYKDELVKISFEVRTLRWHKQGI